MLVTTDRLSEGVDLHRCCRHLIHYELDPSRVRTLQRNGRVRRVGSWAALTGKPIDSVESKAEVEVIGVERGGSGFIPSPGATFQQGDVAHFVIATSAADKLDTLLEPAAE